MNLEQRDPWGTTTAELYRTLRTRADDGVPTVLATVVDVDGAAYRRPGAKMLITPEGTGLGAITAGCLEGPVLDLGTSVLEAGTPQIEAFDLMDDDEWGLGLGCNGIIDVLLEPVDASVTAALSELERHRPVTVVTVIDSSDERVSVGDRRLIAADGSVQSPTEAWDRGAIPSEIVTNVMDAGVIDRVRESAGAATFESQTDGGHVTLFADHLEPIPELLLFGNQNDVHPVVRMGREAGFDVTVVSARGSRSDQDDFPNANRVVSSHPSAIDEIVRAPATTYAVLMSHNLLDDQLALETLLEGTSVPYVGVMGPRERFEELRDGLRDDGYELADADLDRISTPVGLDLGGGEPIHIAMSIVSEVLAVHNDRDGGRLKDREGPIHRRLRSL